MLERLRGVGLASCVVALVSIAAGCGPKVHITQETNAVGLPRPSAVYVYDFAVHPSEVQLDPGGPLARVRKILSGDTGAGQSDEATQLGHQLANQVAESLVKKITAMGLPAQRISRPQHPPVGAVAVTGQFVDVDEGNRVKRMAIGFHQGQSRVASSVQVYRVTGTEAAAELVDFTAMSESAPLPGAAVTMGAGAAVQVGAAAAGAKELGSSIQSDADHLATKVADSLQTFFAKQGWTAPPSSIPDSIPDSIPEL